MQDLSSLIATSNHLFATATLVGAIVVLVWILSLIASRFGLITTIPQPFRFFSRCALPLGFLTALAAAIGSLYYSYYLHIPACDLCWFQRVFIYPLVILFGYAWCKKDTHAYPYIMWVSGIGFVIALYHHYLQMGYDLLKPCSTAPFAVDCATPTFVEYGFVTYPFMAVVTLAFTFLLAYTARGNSK